MQVQIQVLLAAIEEGGATERPNAGPNVEVARLPIFSKEVGNIAEFIIVCMLFLKMKMKEAVVEKQIQWVLLYVQGGSADIQKGNILEDLELGKVEFELAEEFLLELKKEFGEEDEESIKVAELKRVEQERRTMEEFI